MKLDRRYVEKPWGRTVLPPMFDSPAGKRIGEIWFVGDGDPPLMVKYIFTSERLSIQVHPDDVQARQRGLRSGKSECWFILDAEPGARLGLGLNHAVDPSELRAAALDGSIEQLIAWHPVKSGDFVFVPSGTIHAIGAGISLLEFQQNSDVTYRLYDYGRPRELHLDDAIDVALAAPFAKSLIQHLTPDEDRLLVDGPHFRLAHTRTDRFPNRQRWIMPLDGHVRSGEDIAAPGDCLLLQAGVGLESSGARLLIGTTVEPS